MRPGDGGVVPRLDRGAPASAARDPAPLPPLEGPEHRLYGLLARTDPDSAHGRYNALVRRLVRFERAAECVA